MNFINLLILFAEMIMPYIGIVNPPNENELRLNTGHCARL